jgi:hypothetical protein
MRNSLIQNPGLPTKDTCFDLTFTLVIAVKYLMTIKKGFSGEAKLSQYKSINIVQEILSIKSLGRRQ